MYTFLKFNLYNLKPNIEELITKFHKEDMVALVDKQPKLFEELVQVAISEKHKYSWRAAWLLWSCMKKNDSRIKKYVNDFIHTLPNRPDNQQREILKILELMDVSDELKGSLFNHCVAIWERKEKQPSVRFYALKTMCGMAKSHPELSAEIKIMAQGEYIKSLSPGITQSVLKMLKNLR
jgi:hypothetical protein